MKARYIRTSSLHQNEIRQLVRQHPDEKIFIDKISGAIPFNERPQAKELLVAIKKNEINYISTSSIDRMGRSTLDVLQTLDVLTKLNVVVKVDNLGLESLVNGKENPTFKLIISVLANISEMERLSLRERQLEGIQIAKRNGVYKGREKGTSETKEEVLQKYVSVVNYLKRTKNKPSYTEIAKLCDCSKNTVQKVKKVLMES
jgi:DNA invertase Pin-like site-specific DNA recombinase